MIKHKKNKGYTLIELLMVVAITILFGFTAYTLIISANAAYSRMSKELTTSDTERASISYIVSLVRQNDRENSIIIEDDTVLRIVGGGHRKDYDKWIYFEDGNIYEYMGQNEKGLLKNLGMVVIDCEDFFVSMDGQILNIQVNDANQSIGLKTAQGGQP